MSFNLQLVLLQAGIVLLTIVVGGLVAGWLQQQQIRDAYRQQVLTVATSTAALPSVVDAYDDPDPSATLQPLAELIREASDVTFVVLTDDAGVRFTHPDPDRIGEPASTDASRALAGEVFVGTETGTLGESLRAKVPVRDADGRVIGAASVGILESQLDAAFREDVPVLLLWLTGAAALGVVLSVLVARLVVRRTHGLEPEEIAHLLQAREAMLHGIREGVVAVDDGTVVLANEQAVRLLDLDEDPTGRPARAVLDPAVVALLQDEDADADRPLLVGERLLLANRSDAVVRGRRVASVLSLRDRTEVSAALRELDGQRSLTATLRAQAHEFANNLHVVHGLIDLGRPDEAKAYIDRVGGGGDLVTGDGLRRLGDPATAALLLAKAATARERGARLRLHPDSELERGDDDALTALGNLVDNALDAVGQGGHVEVLVAGDDHRLLVRVDDDGPGVDAADRERVFEVGVSSKGEGTAGRGIGLALVRRAAERRGGTVAVDASPLGGARFEVVLPVEAVQRAVAVPR
jgi:two-component system CitB family sensor kinase